MSDEITPDRFLQAKVVLTDPTLFGNDAAEDEQDEIFYSYAVERSDVFDFADQKRSFAIARAYKGEGKSALLRLARRRIRKIKPSPIQVAKTATEMVPEGVKEEYQPWVRAWKAAILSVLATEIGSQLGVAWSDDAMALVEEAEKTGFRKRSLLSSILDRLKLPEVNLGSARITLPERKLLGTVNPGETVKRWAKERSKLWLFVDDLDKNFENTRGSRIRVASFFDACRELLNAIPELRVRTAIRPNVWTILRLEFESLSHVEQYAHDLAWSESDIRRLLSLRIEGYIRRTGQWGRASRELYGDAVERDRSIIATAFESPIRWGQGEVRPPYVALYTLSKRRPRWVVELAKTAAAEAVRRSHTRITRDDIFEELAAFGNRRLQDLAAEFRSQCPDIEELTSAFAQSKEQLTTSELLSLIDNKVLTHLNPNIVGTSGKLSNLQVAAFLYEVGLYYARRQRPDGTYEHFSFSEKPTLLRARTNIDQGVTWEIHPVFRQALELRTPEGREIRRLSQSRR